MAIGTMRFTHYLDDNLLPSSRVERRESPGNGIVFALISHAPSLDKCYGSVDDLVVSIVLRSSYARVVRDVGLGRQAFIETPGCILVTPPRTSSYWHFDARPQVLHIGFPSGTMQHYLDRSPPRAIEHLASKPLYDPLLTLLAERLWATSGATHKFSQIFRDQALTTMLATLFVEPNKSERTLPGIRRSGPALAPWRLKRATELMMAHLADGLPIESLAHNVGLSSYHFLRAFAASTGQTPYQWMSVRRIERAKELLRHRDLSITQIALELGFSSSSHFSTRFRQITGSSPRDWRAMHGRLIDTTAPEE